MYILSYNIPNKKALKIKYNIKGMIQKMVKKNYTNHFGQEKIQLYCDVKKIVILKNIEKYNSYKSFLSSSSISKQF